MKALELSGKRFGALTVLERTGASSRQGVFWTCRCDCGAIMQAASGWLTSGNTSSCGCGQRAAAARACLRRRTHGMTRERLYTIHRAMKARCENPRAIGYKDYGGRGITICAEWGRFEPFKAWALANGYADNLSIDRIDVNGNYEPGNCRWANHREQANNRRSNRLLTHHGVTKSIQQWADEKGVKAGTLIYRVQAGWRGEKLFRQPL